MYQPVPKVPNFPELEHKHLQRWQESRIFQKLREKNQDGECWSFMDGPITANNPMGVHHAWGRSYKDMFQRYHAMNGKQLRYQNGFDCQGLWVEVEVEKEFGFKTKRDIAEFGLDKFVSACKQRVLKYAARQTAQSIRLGYWMDWDEPATLEKLREAMASGQEEVTITTASGATVTGSPENLVGRLGSPEFGGSYFTFADENNYTIWAFLKKCYDEGSIYRGTDVMPWCCRCGTGISQMEVTEGRKITSHTSVFVRFPLLNRDKEALLVWTTTPWTLTSNVAAAVNPEMDYLRVRHGEWTYYVGKGNFSNTRIQELEAAGQKKTEKLHTVQNILKGSGELEVLGEIKGEELLGLPYTGPFDHLPAQQTPGGNLPNAPEDSATSIESHKVIAWDEVSDKEGTGIVHIAPGCGAEDYRLGKEEGLAIVAPLTEEGLYKEEFGDWAGRSVHDVADDIMMDLKNRGLLVAKEKYPHVYPHCWRCKEELVFRLVDEWFIDMQWRDRIQKVVPSIRWIPGDGEAREQDWLKNMGDWMISKKRFWGLALPIWTCDDKECGWFTVVGSREELKERAIEGWDAFDGHAPHRPYVDQVKLKCDTCGGTCSRVEDVGNPWLDAGIVPFSTLHYNTDRSYWEKWFPTDFVVECFPGQFRNWFYALLAMSAMMDGRAPFKVLLGHALVMDDKGQEMHKSTGNSIAFDEAAEVLGAEVMRYLYASQNPVINLNFPVSEAKGEEDTAPKKGKKGKKEQNQKIAAEIRRKLLTLWNCYSFFVTYATVDEWKPKSEPIPVSERSDLDRWILSRLQNLIDSSHRAFGEYTLYRFMNHLERFNDEFSNWYLRRSRRRFWKSQADQDKDSAYQTLYDVLKTQILLLAPILPFLTDEMYQNLVQSVDAEAAESIHLEDYPQRDEALVDDTLEQAMDCVMRIRYAALSCRNQAKVKIRQPLSTLLIRPRNDADRAFLENPDFVAHILEEVNLKGIQLIDRDTEESMISRSLRANKKVAGRHVGRHLKALDAWLQAANVEDVLQATEGDEPYTITLDGEDVEIVRDYIEIVYSGPEHLAFVYDYNTFIALDKTISPELAREGIARDFNRQVQELRKQSDLNVADRIAVEYVASDEVAAGVEEHLEYLKGELLAISITRQTELKDSKIAKVGEEKIHIALEKQ